MPEAAGPQQPEATKPGSERPDLSERASEEQIEAMADRMIDGLIARSKGSPETAQTQPAKCSEIEVDGDRGEDIDDRLESLFAGEPVTGIAEPQAEVEVVTSVDVSPAEAPVPARPVPETPVPAAVQMAPMAEQPAIPWSHTVTKPRTEIRRRGGSPKSKWLVAAALVGGITSLAWLVLAPGSGPVEETRVVSEISTPRRTVARALPPVEEPAALVEPEPIPVPPVTAAPVEPEPIPVPPVTAALVEPEPIPVPPVTAAPVEPEPIPVPPVTAAPVEPEPIPVPPVTATSVESQLTFELPVTQASVIPEVARETVPSPPEPVAEPTVPELISRQAPVYRKRDGPGVVVLKVLVAETGRVSRVVVEEGIPGSPLEASAIDAALRSTYRPATENGRPAKAWIVERFEFE